MKAEDWTYDGDIDLRQGGMFWTDDGEADPDGVRLVRVMPLSDAGGPDNLFRVEKGDVHLGDPDRVRAALESAGITEDGMGEGVTLGDKVRAVIGHWGMEEDEVQVVRIGAPDPSWGGRGPNPEPDRVLPPNAHLRNFVAREFLSLDRAPPNWGPRG